jgi:hypothetical protein
LHDFWYDAQKKKTKKYEKYKGLPGWEDIAV